jgi:hypothetical protein
VVDGKVANKSAGGVVKFPGGNPRAVHHECNGVRYVELPALGLRSVGNNDPAPHSVGAAELLYLHVSGLLSVRSVPFVGVGAFGKFEVFDWWCGCVGGVGDFARGWCKTWCWCLWETR